MLSLMPHERTLCFGVIAHTYIYRYVARVTAETHHESAKGGHRIEDTLGCFGLSHKETTCGVKGRVAHMDEYSAKSWHIAEKREFSTPWTCPRITAEIGESWRNKVKPQAIPPFGDCRLAWNLRSSRRSRAWF